MFIVGDYMESTQVAQRKQIEALKAERKELKEHIAELKRHIAILEKKGK
jgi:cell division protein FtsB